MKLVVLLLPLVTVFGEEFGPCFLRDGDPAKKPFPSLTQCYKNNQDACCVSGHDATIADAYSSILSSTCLREYSHLEHFFCLGCNPVMNNFIQWYNTTTADGCVVGGDCKYSRYNKDAEEGVVDWKARAKHGKYGMIKICETFLDNLLYTDEARSSGCKSSQVTCPVDKYDNCGLILESHGKTQGSFPSSFFVDANGKPDYLLFLKTIRPTYFDSNDFHISVSYLSDKTADQTAVEANSAFYHEAWKDQVCFDAAPTFSTTLAFVVVMAHFTRLLA